MRRKVYWYAAAKAPLAVIGDTAEGQDDADKDQIYAAYQPVMKDPVPAYAADFIVEMPVGVMILYPMPRM